LKPPITPKTHKTFAMILLSLAATAFWSLHSAVRENTVLDSGWRFHQGDPSGAKPTDFDDAGWPRLSVNWVWLDASPTRRPALAKMLWILGFHLNQRRGV
jgi:hypothetical protein